MHPNQYIEIKREEELIAIDVAVITWPEPHLPQTEWILIDTLPKTSTNEEIKRAVNKLLKNKKYFKTCIECHETNVKGHMHDSKICMSCAENNHGVDH